MAFMSEETEADFMDILKRFKSMIPISPSLITMDQSAACISATEKVFETSFISLDEWHLNQNQMKNVTSWCATIGRSQWCDDMSRDLFNLRRSRSLSSFTTRRSEFEAKYFQGFTEKLPNWYSYLYLHKPQLLVPCFRNAAVPRLYLFQGTRYTEASNAGYRAYILAKKVPFSAIPKQLKWLTSKRAAERSESRLRSMTPSSSRFRSIRDCQLPLPVSVVDWLIAEYTSYCLTKFKDISVVPSKNYVVTRVSVLSFAQVEWPELRDEDENRISSVACFELAWSVHLLQKVDSSPPRDQRTLKVLFARKDIESEYGGESELFTRCDCQKTQSMGFPCRHIMKCAMAYGDMAEQKPGLGDILDDYIEVENFFDDYWRGDSEQFDYLRVCNLRKEARVLDIIRLKGQLEDERYETQELDTYFRGPSEEEVGSWVKWSDSQALFDQIRRVTSGIGPYAVNHFQQVLRTAMDTYSEGKLPCLSAFTTFKVGENSATKKDVITWENSSFPVVKPPNKSHVKLFKRKKSYTERFCAKKAKIQGLARSAGEVSQSQQSWQPRQSYERTAAFRNSNQASVPLLRQEAVQSATELAISIIENGSR